MSLRLKDEKLRTYQLATNQFELYSCIIDEERYFYVWKEYM